MDKQAFLETFAGVFEHSPWITEKVWARGLDEQHDTAAGLHQAFCQVIQESGQQAQTDLLRAHPDLAVGIAGKDSLTEASRKEQQGAGLDQCSAEEFSAFQQLNETYRERFGFPFIMAVKGHQRRGILETFRHRIKSNPDDEFQTALEQVMRIGLFRIESIFN